MNLIFKYLKNFTIIEILLFIFFILIIYILIKSYFNNKEGFATQHKQLILKKNNEIYDDFYIKVFDLLSFNKIITDFEIGNIINNTNPTGKSIILDIGSKTGYTLNILNEFSKNIIGLEISDKMINKAIEYYPHLKNKFLREDPLNNQLFENNTFTHILALNSNFYNIENKNLFLENSYNWLMPGGYLVLHLINDNTIDINSVLINIKSNLLPDIDPRLLLTNSIKFTDFIYKPKYHKINSNLGIFEENFKFNNGDHRKQELTFYFLPISQILKMAKYLGFIVLKEYKLKSKFYKKNNLYIFQKPY